MKRYKLTEQVRLVLKTVLDLEATAAQEVWVRSFMKCAGVSFNNAFATNLSLNSDKIPFPWPAGGTSPATTLLFTRKNLQWKWKLLDVLSKDTANLRGSIVSFFCWIIPFYSRSSGGGARDILRLKWDKWSFSLLVQTSADLRSSSAFPAYSLKRIQV